MLPSGRRKFRLEIRRHAEGAVGSLGTPTDTWPAADPPEVVPASREDVSDGEKIAADALLAVRRTRFVVRRTPRTLSVTGKDRLFSGGVLFAVIGIKRVNDDRDLEFTAEARADA